MTSPFPVHDYSLDSFKETELPRLNIAVFCTSKHLYDVAGQMANDRRLLNQSKISVYSGSIAEAVETFRDTQTPHMLIIESHLGVVELLTELEDLADICHPETNVMIAGQVNDVDMYRQLTQQGIKDYLLLPINPNKIIETISHIYTEGKASPLASMISFIGATGSVGTSTIAQNFILELSRKHHAKSCFVDLDLTYGQTSMAWNITSVNNFKEVIKNHETITSESIQNFLVGFDNHVNLLQSPMQHELHYEDTHDNYLILDSVWKNLRRSHDIIVNDISAGDMNIIKKAAIIQSTHLYLIMTPTIRSVRNMSMLLNFIKQIRPNEPAPKIILSQVSHPDMIELKTSDIEKSLGISIEQEFHYYPDAIERAIAEGKLVKDVQGSDEFISEIHDFISGFFGKRTTVKKNNSLLQNILSKLLRG